MNMKESGRRMPYARVNNSLALDKDAAWMKQSKPAQSQAKPYQSEKPSQAKPNLKSDRQPWPFLVYALAFSSTIETMIDLVL